MNRAQKTSDYIEKCCKYNKENKHLKRTTKDANKHALQLKKRHEQYHKKKQKHILRIVDLNQQQDDLQN